jgi:DNA uptake protein ComE-like DNA-binding protein
MADGHWLDPLARSLLEASGQLPARPKPAATQVNQSNRSDRQGAPGQDDQGTSSNAATANSTTANAASDPEAAAIERELLALKLRHNPGLRLTTAAEVRHAAALGWRLDVNRATAPDWLRLPGISPHQVDLLLRLQAGGVQLSGPDDLQQLLELPGAQIRCWEPLLLFRWYGEPATPQARQLDLNRASASQIPTALPGLTPERCQRLVRERQRAPFRDLADLQQRLQLPAAVVEELIGRVRFSQGPAGPLLPRPS